jgi:hypothetical protein
VAARPQRLAIEAAPLNLPGPVENHAKAFGPILYQARHALAIEAA